MARQSLTPEGPGLVEELAWELDASSQRLRALADSFAAAGGPLTARLIAGWADQMADLLDGIYRTFWPAS